jgi:hypothetical protein
LVSGREGEVVADSAHGGGAFADGRWYRLHRARTNVAHSEEAGLGHLERERTAVTGRSLDGSGLALPAIVGSSEPCL